MTNMVGYMKYFTVPMAVFFLSFSAYAIEFEQMSIDGYEKKIVSEKQIRFVKKNNSKKVIHLQVSHYDPRNLWKEETLKEDINKMFGTRKEMYKVFGFSDVDFYDYKLTKLAELPQLDIFGTYRKINDKKVYFSESNIYFASSFLQVKVMTESEKDSAKITEKEIKNILTQIKAQELEVK